MHRAGRKHETKEDNGNGNAPRNGDVHGKRKQRVAIMLILAGAERLRTGGDSRRRSSSRSRQNSAIGRMAYVASLLNGASFATRRTNRFFSIQAVFVPPNTNRRPRF